MADQDGAVPGRDGDEPYQPPEAECMNETSDHAATPPGAQPAGVSADPDKKPGSYPEPESSPSAKRPRRIRRRFHAAASLVVTALLLFVLAVGYGPVPALGSALEPGGGVWNSGGNDVASTKTVRLPGMTGTASVSFDSAGVPAVHARSDSDLFEAEGYLHASFRLSQLDLERRTAEGRLAELDGPAAVASDTFELQSGLLRTAQATWAATPKDSPDAQALLAYSRGVNAYLAQVRKSGAWPTVFLLTGVFPKDWTPVDSLAIQVLLTQNLDYSTGPLAYALFQQSLGADRTMAWFPVIAPNQQQPYDPGPYPNLGVSPLPATQNADAAVPAGARLPAPADPATDSADSADSTVGTTAGAAAAATDVLSKLSALPPAQLHAFPDSNSWAANGPAVSGAASLLAGDPHLQTTLPSFWYELELTSPETDASGASLVGLPGIAIGRNQSISWSMTAGENQSTFFYTEQQSPQHPGQYYWDGAWRDMEHVHYTIPVRGGTSVSLTVDLTVHGPIITQAGQTTSVTWMGNYPTRLVQAILGVDKAKNFDSFHSALAAWHAPALNFTYADGTGDIGIIAAGYFAQVAGGSPWLPMPGTGADDVVGTVPYAAAPLVHNPANHVVATANQRPVGPDYPYYIGTSLNAFDNGYRADELYAYLTSHQGMTADDFRAMQTDVTDALAQQIVPELVSTLNASDALPVDQKQALALLSSWDDRMSTDSAAASVWATFWSDYVSGVFQPWWDAAEVPVDTDKQDIQVSDGNPSLDEDLQVWTLNDPANAAFSPPGHPGGTARTAMRAAFAKAVSDLSGKLGSDPSSWQWGRLHTREIPALTGAPGLGYGPAPAEGDRWTVDATEGDDWNSSFGPSWRMVSAWTSPGRGTAQAIYPGGQSENPQSSWYQTFIADYWAGRLRPLPLADDRAATPVVWTLTSGG